ncbi:MAG: hypothetical protein M3N09_02270 [Actinomycetota bacterium]|nr:hypothetical protein [Actinomycetota bacterium]
MDTMKDTAPRYRVRFTADQREHDAHAAFIAREDAQAFVDALTENVDVSNAHIVCSDCDDDMLCDDCASYPLLPARKWSVEPYVHLFSAEHCEQCVTTVCVPDEGLHTDDGLVLCWGCAEDGMPAAMYERRMRERTPADV